MSAMSRLAGVAVTTLVVALFTPAAPAQASVLAQARSTSTVAINSARERATVTGATLPLGRVKSAGKGTNRVYATFDLSPWSAYEVEKATVYLTETQVTRCSAKARVNAYASPPVAGAITWENAPRTISQLPASGRSPDCPAILNFDAATAVAQALAAGQPTLTIAFRLDKHQEEGEAFGRMVSSDVRLDLTLKAPVSIVPGSMTVDGTPCTTTGPGPLGGKVRALGAQVAFAPTSFPDQQSIDEDIEYWPVADPNLKQGTSRIARADQPTITTVNVNMDGEWAWHARARGLDGNTSEWSPTCYFRVDATAPAPPAISVGQPAIMGRPLTITIGPSDPDVNCYQYVFGTTAQPPIPTGPDYCAAPSRVRTVAGAAVTVTVTPTKPWSVLMVRAIDQFGNMSTPYQTTVLAAAP